MKMLLSIEGIGMPLPGVRLSGSEGISELFRYDIHVVQGFSIGGIAGALLDKLGMNLPQMSAIRMGQRFLDAITNCVGQNAILTFDTGEYSRTVHGIISEFTQCDDGKTGTTYHAVLVPEVSRLLHRKDCRIFQEMSAPEIIAAVLDESGIRAERFRFALEKERPKRTYCVEYQESDWAFVARLLEEEGIHFYFDDNVLVMADHPTAHVPIEDGLLVFRPPLGAMAHGEHVSRFAWTERLSSGKATLRDYDFVRPSLSLEVLDKADVNNELDVYEFPGRYDTPDRGKDLARMRLQALRTRARTGAGESDSCRLIPGKTFLLTDHPDDTMNVLYVVMRVEHRGTTPLPDAVDDAESSYENAFEVVRADVVIRPMRQTPKPIMHGMQSAVVVGPGHEEVHTDVHGRIKVQFHWDRRGKKNDRSSCWLRVMQPLAGAGYGAMFLPRIGHEVVVSFLEGDPDQPIVVGSVYNGANVPPYPLPQDKTRSGIRTKTFGADGHNEVRFDDARGAEEFYVHAQRDYNDVTERNRSTVVHGERRQTIDKNDAEHVRGNQGLTVDGNQHVHVRGNQRTIIDGNDPDHAAGFRGAGTTVRGKYAIDASDTITIEAPTKIVFRCGASIIEMTPGTITASAGGGAKQVLDANALVESAAGSRVFVDANVFAKASGGAEVLLDANARATSYAGAEILLDGNACMSSTGGKAVADPRGNHPTCADGCRGSRVANVARPDEPGYPAALILHVCVNEMH